MPPNPAIASTEEIVAELKAGRMVVLVDEEDRENEGDLVMAAEHVTPEAINFMAKYGRGLICLLSRKRTGASRPFPIGRAARTGYYTRTSTVHAGHHGQQSTRGTNNATLHR